MIYLTSDFHIGHTNIIKFCNRPFHTIEQMEQDCLDYISKNVVSTDEIWHLGDFHWSKDALAVKSFLDKIPCQVRFIRGNHDHGLDNLKDHKNNQERIEIYDEYILKYKQCYVTLNHYCKYTWYKRRYNQFHCYGHSHCPSGSHFGFGKSMEVGYDSQGKWLISIEEVIDVLSKRDINAEPTFDLFGNNI